MILRFSATVFCLYVSVLIGGPTAHAQAIDPHALYEQRCSGCHAPHAGEFARGDLERVGGAIVGRRSGKDVQSFLERGHGKLSPREIDVMVAHLTSIVEAGSLFRDKCFICHGRAVVLARSELILRDGTLYGRYSGRNVEAFLEHHGRLSGPQVATIVAMLKGQLAAQKAD